MIGIGNDMAIERVRQARIAAAKKDQTVSETIENVNPDLYYVVATRGIGYWPNGCGLANAWRFASRDRAQYCLDRAALTESGRSESAVVEVLGGFPQKTTSAA